MKVAPVLLVPFCTRCWFLYLPAKTSTLVRIARPASVQSDFTPAARSFTFSGASSAEGIVVMGGIEALIPGVAGAQRGRQLVGDIERPLGVQGLRLKVAIVLRHVLERQEGSDHRGEGRRNGRVVERQANHRIGV